MKLLNLFIPILFTFCNGAVYYAKNLGCDEGYCGGRCDIKNSKETCSNNEPESKKTAMSCVKMIHMPWDPLEVKCACQCQRDCAFSEFIEYSSACGINSISTVDEEIAKQIIYYTTGAVASNIPVIGPIFDIAFAAWGPFSPVTSPFSLINTLRKEVDASINALSICFKEQIAISKVQATLDLEYGLITQYENAKGAAGDDQISKINSLFTDWTRQMAAIFGLAEKSHIEYRGMLPVYLTLFPMYSTVVALRYQHLMRKTPPDVRNWDNDKATVNQVYADLKRWIGWAKESIRNSTITFIASTPCRNSLAADLTKWGVDFDQKWAKNLDKLYSWVGTEAPTSAPTPGPTSYPTLPPNIFTPIPHYGTLQGIAEVTAHCDNELSVHYFWQGQGADGNRNHAKSYGPVKSQGEEINFKIGVTTPGYLRFDCINSDGGDGAFIATIKYAGTWKTGEIENYAQRDVIDKNSGKVVMDYGETGYNLQRRQDNDFRIQRYEAKTTRNIENADNIDNGAKWIVFTGPRMIVQFDFGTNNQVLHG